MGGTNPYIEKTDHELPKVSYTLTFIQPKGDSTTVTVDPEKLPYGETGLPGSILDIAMGHGVDLEHVCGGVCACSTCHVIVKQGLETCNEGTDDE
ncbi:MAG: 2Fe-2S iron-sulfur cluster binding domain-containing protein, partial [Nitrospira sp.]|nr:2Fe-2S iron-sulfur cluster binding domain-containing protein [Nitrospira sp.]